MCSRSTGGASDGIAITAVRAAPAAEGNAWHVTIEWSATARPEQDYSTVVFASDQDVREITAPDQILAQSDARAPVYGWHATSGWQPGEAIREDHMLAVPEGSVLRTLVIGAYVQEPDGAFTTLGRSAWTRVDEVWRPVN